MFVIDVWMQLINTVNQFRTGQIDLPTFIMNILTILANAYRTIFTTIIGLVVRFASQMIQRGISAATRFVNGIITWLKSLPGKAYSALLQVVSRITNAGAMWVRAAKQKAKEIITNVYNTLTGLPGQIASALSGVAEAFAKPFRDAYDKVCKEVDKIKDKVDEGMEWIGNLGGAQAGEEADGRVSLLDSATNYNITTDNSPVTVDHNLNISLDLKNVPSGMDSDTLIAALTDRKVLSALTGNSDFQLFDGKAKERLNLKVNRSRGV